jgi:hypothetical protein
MANSVHHGDGVATCAMLVVSLKPLSLRVLSRLAGAWLARNRRARNCALAVRDYYHFWKSRNEFPRAGKLLLDDPSDASTIQMFFDDNIGTSQRLTSQMLASCMCLVLTSPKNEISAPHDTVRHTRRWGLDCRLHKCTHSGCAQCAHWRLTAVWDSQGSSAQPRRACQCNIGPQVLHSVRSRLLCNMPLACAHSPWPRKASLQSHSPTLHLEAVICRHWRHLLNMAMRVQSSKPGRAQDPAQP